MIHRSTQPTGTLRFLIIKLTLKQYFISLLAIKDTISEEKRA